MKLSMKWLNDYVSCEGISPRQYAEGLTMSGSKVEGYAMEGSELKNIVVGQLLSVEKHPDADRLSVCQVDVGNDTIQIVTGATNVAATDKVPVALDGAVIHGGKEIKSGALRGVKSQGMLCSLSELGLTVNDFPYAVADGIFVLQEDGTPGQDIREVLGLNDLCVEFEITPNRPDCLSVIGLARETAATFDRPLRLPQPRFDETADPIADVLSVSIDAPDLCFRYMARMVKNVRIGPSPRWMRERLRASGVRPINNIVDITNYVMLEYGQPMHAFDARFIKGGHICVRRAKADETLTTLDGVERALTEDMLVIANATEPMALAGIMGGEYSGIMEDTTDILFESACFMGPSVRTTSRGVGLRTDSSARFEKGLDPENCAPALERACELVAKLQAGDVAKGVIDCRVAPKPPTVIALETDWINAFLGTQIAEQTMESILKKIGFSVVSGQITVPSFRKDVEHKADIAEEIARFYGYNNIGITALRGSAQGIVSPSQRLERTLTAAARAQGYNEIVTYSFISPKLYDKILMPASSPLRQSVRIRNPLGEETSIMRTTALPSMLENLAHNYNNRAASACLYELASEYLPCGDDELPQERKMLVLGQYGDGLDFFALKGALEEMLKAVSVTNYETHPVADRPAYHPGRCAVLSAGGDELAVLGELHPAVLENFGISTRTCVAVLDFAVMQTHGSTVKSYRPLPRFPAVQRDLALVCPRNLSVGQLERVIRTAAGGLLESLELFDVYEGEQVGGGQRSLAFSLTLRAADRTLTDADSDELVASVVDALAQEGAMLRS